ncbi:bifunctional serine/threonine-protein kinase/formylglycine-generating enzyme family protein [Myxococcus sp. RHSTA-1-4]|uniref:bifunctional serine/threonine-protein kinase/formylglycine-generating enzyme family protein n=1 Tax=Myxococcus sp. RHSTA-1-4 TaxID=2874601 RepID=UPI001CBCAD2C|nr:bifunctional serine/threonine-protein kinase/formylglycine-generating enzyme family protein [Myxococcus sp. RHSTA-1-4]
MEGRLSADVLARLHRHAAGCDACRKLMATVARGGLAMGAAAVPVQDSTQSIPVPPARPPPAEVAEEPAPEPATPWTPPAEFDEFRLGPLLGRGGMGLVYLAQDTSLGRAVAVKFIASSRPRPMVRAYFETEARAIARLQHPNVVTVYRVGTVDGQPYIVSEYVVGRSLAHLPVPLPWRRVLTLGLGLARGLAAAHRQGVLHRDLKPSNALVTDDDVVKLLDFGLAEYFDPGTLSPASRARQAAGTPRYMAPELFQGEPASPQSDIYSLGVTLYELCTGSTPPGTPVKGLPHGAPGADTPGSGLAPDVDPEFAALIMHCLAPAPAERPGSADLLREALERLEQLHAATPLAAGNPYRGLAPFEAEHRSLFFGRDADIRAVIERLRRLPMVLVAGDSGVGKSSLCRAGVLPRVEAGALDGGRHMVTVTLWPGPRPLQALAAALVPVLGMKEQDVVHALTAVPDWLGPTLRTAYQERRGLLIFIDQLEELLTQAEPAQAARFALLLGELALPSPGVRVLMAVRGDFLTSVSSLPGLGDEAERALYILRPMTPAGVREAIIGPARGRGVSFESEELIQTLVESMAHGAGSLPLLQFALAELWERRNPAHSRITKEALEAMGGVAGALSRHADGVLARLTPTEKEAARRLLLNLVTAEGTRLELGEAELLPTPDAAPRTALRALTEGRILHTYTVGWAARYVIAHDSLIESWGTLRNWRDRDIGHRAVRQRLEAASAEWERLSRAPEALWGQRHVDEARPLDSALLGPRERAFLAASQRAVRLQRWGRYLAALGGVLALAGLYGGLRLHGHLEDQRFIDGHVAAAREDFAEGRELAEKTRARREEALALFSGRVSPPPGSAPTHLAWSLPEKLWAEALRLREETDASFARATEFLERALERERGYGDAHRLLAEVLHERMRLAEDFHQDPPAAELRGRLERLVDETDEGAWLYRLQLPAEFQVETEPPGARVELGRYVKDAQGVLRREPRPPLGTTPLTGTRLPAGSYHLRISHPGHATVDLPVLLTRGTHEKVRLSLPASVPDGYVYIPPGCFLLGSADPERMRDFLHAAPLHRHCLTEGYVIGRTEVTFGDWVAWLDSLPPEAAARRILEEPRFNGSGKAVTLKHQARTGWTFSFHVAGDDVLSAREGEDIHYPGRSRRQSADWRRLPLSGVSTEDLAGYFYWLDRTGRLPGARLCTEHEWEYAARGADGRAFPHGDRLLPDDANFDTTYGREPSAFGPDMVGSYPVSASPFGLMDMAGNAYELTRSVTADLGRIVLKGGAWYYESATALTANRTAGTPTLRDMTTGVRVCASYPPR